MSGDPSNESPAFATTHWSVVAAAGADDASHMQARKALEHLCRAYWYPLYSFVRRRGYAADDAQDLTQAFFAKFLALDGFGSADRSRGRFRSYLLGSMKNFLANEWDKAKTRKRGGEIEFLEWDSLEPEARYALEGSSGTDAEMAFDRGWALECFKRATEALRRECEAKGKGELFDAPKGYLAGEEPGRNELLGVWDSTTGPSGYPFTVSGAGFGRSCGRRSGKPLQNRRTWTTRCGIWSRSCAKNNFTFMVTGAGSSFRTRAKPTVGDKDHEDS